MSETYDYISPGYEPVFANTYFPHRVQGPQREIIVDNLTPRVDPHNWWYDGRWPPTGFVNCDEAHILHELAKQCAGKAALEIGCLLGFSAWHLLHGGVKLSICDPGVQDLAIRASVYQSLRDYHGRYTLLGVPSPRAAIELAIIGNEYWSLVFIDGAHDAPQPLLDTIAARHCCADDAMIVFHDALYSGPWQAIAFLRADGWKVKLYQTSQMIAVCYRGNIQPVDHTPDPAIVALPLAQHLKELM